MRVWLVVVLAACGDNIGAIEIDEYPAAYHEAACARSLACGTIANRAECDLPNVNEYTFDARYLDALREGRITWDPVAAYNCLARWEQSGCDWTSEDYRSLRCAPVTHGTLDEGETCLLSAECISNECWNEDCLEACCAGTCVGAIEPSSSTVGEQCRTAGCTDGWCDGSVCQPFAAEGDACEVEEACAYGLACRTRKCVALANTGEPCTPNYLNGCRMLGDRCSSVTYRCEPNRTTGAVCLTDQECTTLYRCRDGHCALDRAELGEACDYDYQCATPGAVCAWFDDGCILPRAAGEPCTLYNQCESGICDYQAGVCASLDGCL